MSGNRETLISAFYSAYNTHDAAEAARLYAPDASHTEAASGRIRTGREAIQAGLAGFLGMLDDLAFTTGPAVHAGPHSLVPYRMEGRMARQIGPFPATGKSVVLVGIHRFVFRDGLIQETHDYWDEASFISQITPEPG